MTAIGLSWHRGCSDALSPALCCLFSAYEALKEDPSYDKFPYLN